jgi:hypothetical protein
MAIIFNPVPSLDLGEPIRASVTIPIHLLAHFDPTVDLSHPEKLHYIMRQTKATTFAIAQSISIALFGSTQSVPDPFTHVVSSYEDGPAEAVSFSLHHGMSQDAENLNPVYIYISAGLVDGCVVFTTKERTGEDRQRSNWRYEKEQGDRRRWAASAEEAQAE